MMILGLLLIPGVAAVVLLAKSRRSVAVGEDEVLSDARADARRWYERLGGQLMDLRDDGHLARQALTDATERHQTAGGQLAQARTVPQYRMARESALEGLAYVRAARTTLGLDPGPNPPPPAAARGAGTVVEERELNAYRAGPRATAATPYYYPGGWPDGRPMPAGWYSAPWWKTTPAAGTLGGMLLLGPAPSNHDFH